MTTTLTAREQDVFELVTQRLPAKLIAKRLWISPRTVETHLERIYRKHGVAGREALIEQLEGQHDDEN